MAYRMTIALPDWGKDFLENYRASNGLRSLNAAIIRLLENESDRQIDRDTSRNTHLRQANSTKGEGE